MRVLIIEDEEALASAIARGLRREGMAVDVALDGAGGLEKALVNSYDAIVLDRNLPGLGADDYLGKPFAFDELVARLRALSRRAGTPRPPVLRRHDVKLDPASRHAWRQSRELELTNKEFGVLEALLAANGAVVSGEELLEKVWDENTDPFSNVVRVTIMTLRKKLGAPPLIETLAGSGYRV